MAAILRSYDPSVLSEKIKSTKLKDKELVKLGKDSDPSGKGISIMTWRRLKAGQNVKIEILCLACYALGITPESTLKKVTL